MPINQKQKIIVILGPTASGKSSLSIKLAKKFNGEIISADSRQVYQGMDIGTGKVTKKEQGLIKHHLLNVVNPKKVFTVSDFKKLGEKAIKEILGKNKIPIIVGGTGLYIDTLVYNLNFPQVPPNQLLRLSLNRLTAEQLFYKLKNLDLQRAKTIDHHNKRRLIRALEIIDSIGKVPTLNTKYYIENTKYDVLWLGLKPKNLENKIKLRLNKRLKKGMIKEIKDLLESGVSKKRLHDLGLEYRQISEYLASKNYKVTTRKRSERSSNPMEQWSHGRRRMTESVKNFKKSEYYQKLLREIVKYSKRQMTWFKINKEIHWLAQNKVEGIKTQKEAEKLLQSFL